MLPGISVDIAEAQASWLHTAGRYPAAPVLSLRAQRFGLRIWLIVTDAMVLGAAFLAAYWLRFGLQVTVSPDVIPAPIFYRTLAVFLTLVCIAVFAAFRLYDPDQLLGGVSEYSRIFNACSAGTMIVVLATFLQPAFVVSRFWVVAAWLLSFVMVALNRFVCRRLVYPLRRRGYFLTPAIVVGINEEAVTLVDHLSDWRSSGLRLLGFVSSRSSLLGPTSLPVLGDLRDIREVIETHGVEDLIVAITALDREALLRLCEDVNSIPGVHLRLSSGLYELLTTGITVQTKGNVPLVSVNKVRLEPEESFIKTLLEYSIALTAIVLLSPLLLGLAVIIKLDSPGPVLFRRRVLGVSGKVFDAFKFRTMHVNGQSLLPAELHAQLRMNHKLKDDPRVTRVGRWLRKYSLDELPQLFNVLLGQMGLVGPRMITQEEAEKVRAPSLESAHRQARNHRTLASIGTLRPLLRR